MAKPSTDKKHVDVINTQNTLPSWASGQIITYAYLPEPCGYPDTGLATPGANPELGVEPGT